MGLLQGGAPSTAPGGFGRGLGLGLGGFNQGYQGAINSALKSRLVGAQISEHERKEKQRLAQQAAIESMFTPVGPQFAMADTMPSGRMVAPDDPRAAPVRSYLAANPVDLSQFAGTESDRPGPTPVAAGRMQPPIARLFPGADVPALRNFATAFPDEFKKTVGERLAPKPPTQTEYDRLIADAQSNDPFRRQTARAILARRGMAPQTTLNVDSRTLGNIPPGYQLKTAPDGSLRMEPIPGSPAADKADAAKQTEAAHAESAARAGNV